jgi:hypothetical protein
MKCACTLGPPVDSHVLPSQPPVADPDAALGQHACRVPCNAPPATAVKNNVQAEAHSEGAITGRVLKTPSWDACPDPTVLSSRNAVDSIMLLARWR